VQGTEKRLVHKQRQRAGTLGVVDTWTPEQWKAALQYFNHCCAICGRQLKDLFGTHTAAADHWIALSKGGSTTAINILPLCHGEDGCNNSKGNKDPVEWLIERFGKRKAKKKLAEIEAYFKWVRQQENEGG